MSTPVIAALTGFPVVGQDLRTRDVRLTSRRAIDLLRCASARCRAC
jgi:hypothetical protein